MVQSVATKGMPPAHDLPEYAGILIGDLTHTEKGDLHALLIQHIQKVEDLRQHAHTALPAVIALQVVQMIPFLQVHGKEGPVHAARRCGAGC